MEEKQEEKQGHFPIFLAQKRGCPWLFTFPAAALSCIEKHFGNRKILKSRT